MLCNVIWLDSAQMDMDALYEYYRENSIAVAVRIHNGIIDETDLLIHNPYLAPVEPCCAKHLKTYRSLVVSKGKFKVIYFVENQTIYIARVWACKQNPDNITV
jgi:plasmid stabilization system protein ParE